LKDTNILINKDNTDANLETDDIIYKVQLFEQFYRGEKTKSKNPKEYEQYASIVIDYFDDLDKKLWSASKNLNEYSSYEKAKNDEFAFLEEKLKNTPKHLPEYKEYDDLLNLRKRLFAKWDKEGQDIKCKKLKEYKEYEVLIKKLYEDIDEELKIKLRNFKESSKDWKESLYVEEL